MLHCRLGDSARAFSPSPPAPPVRRTPRISCEAVPARPAGAHEAAPPSGQPKASRCRRKLRLLHPLVRRRHPSSRVDAHLARQQLPGLPYRRDDAPERLVAQTCLLRLPARTAPAALDRDRMPPERLDLSGVPLLMAHSRRATECAVRRAARRTRQMACRAATLAAATSATHAEPVRSEERRLLARSRSFRTL